MAYCKLCKLNSGTFGNFIKHCKTLKHLRKEESFLICIMCDITS